MPAPEFRSTVVALALGQLLCWAALFYAFTSFVLPMQTALGWSKPQTMGAFTLGLAVWGGASYAVGARIDAGHGRTVLTLGAALAGIGFLVWSQAQHLATLYVAWAVLGAAMAMTLYDPAFSVLTKRFPARYRDGITALTLVGGFASTLAFPAAAWLIANLGWRAALAMIGALLLVGVAPLHAWALRGETGHAPAAAPLEPIVDSTLAQALRQRSFWLLTMTFTLYAFVAAAIWAHMMPAFAAKGRGEAEALAVVVWFGPAQVLGRVAYLAFGRRIPAHRLGLVVLAGVPVSLVIFALAEQTVALLAFALLFGVANGLVTIVRGSVVPEFYGRRHVGRISGAITAISLFARAGAPLLAAWLLLALPGYREMLLVLAAIGAGAVAAFAFSLRR